MSDTATVELLTAEVRVLMVGSRQVTLSVAKQLDHVVLEAIEPFGRVRLGDREEVIGCSPKTGALVLARFDYYPHRTPCIAADDLDDAVDGLPIVCDKLALTGDGYGFNLTLSGRAIKLSADAISYCGQHPHGVTDKGQCMHWNPAGHEKSIQTAIAAWDAGCALHDQAKALPLIVLAGLK